MLIKKSIQFSMPKFFMPRLSGASLLLALSCSAVAIPNLDTVEQTSPEQLLQELGSLPLYSPSDQSSAMRLQNAQQAKKMLAELETEFRQAGDLRNILAFAPRIIELLPDDADIRYMYVIALAAKGDVASAEGALQGVRRDSDANALYVSLAKAAIAKAGDKLQDADLAAKKAVSIDAKHPYAYNILGQLAASRKDYAKALASFQAAVAQAPDFVAAWSNLGSVQLLQGDADSASASFSTAIKLSPDYCAPRLGRSLVSTAQGYANSAITDLEACIAAEPEQMQATKQLVSLYLQVGRLDDAEKIVRPLLLTETGFSRVTLADIYLRRGQPENARQQLAAITTPDAQVNYLLSFCDMQEGRDNDAIRHIEAALALQPETATEAALALQPETATLQLARQIYTFYAGGAVDQASLLTLGQDVAVGKLALFVAGNVQASQRNQEAAYKLWTEAGDLLPGFTLEGVTVDEVRKAVNSDEQRYLALGMLFYLKNLYPASLSQFNKALAVNPDSFMANYFAALVFAHSNDRDGAGMHLERSLKKTPGFFPANYMLAEVFLQRGDFDSAIRHYQAAADSKPDGGVLVKLGLLYEQKGRRDDAVKAYRKFIAVFPNNFIGYNQLAWMYARDGEKLDEALTLAKKADALQPDNVSINDTLGWIYFQKDDYKQAENYLQHASSISNGVNPDVLYHLAALKNAMGEKEAAKSLLDKALNTPNNFESAAKARELLHNLNSK